MVHWCDCPAAGVECGLVLMLLEGEPNAGRHDMNFQFTVGNPTAVLWVGNYKQDVWDGP